MELIILILVAVVGMRASYLHGINMGKEEERAINFNDLKQRNEHL